jgi:hypothetical protein
MGLGRDQDEGEQGQEGGGEESEHLEDLSATGARDSTPPEG